MSIKESIGARIRLRRETLEMTQVELAKQAGLYRGTVISVEHGRTKMMPLSLLVRVSMALNDDPVRLATGARRRGPEREWVAWEDLIRRKIRSARLDSGMGTKAAAAAAGVHQSWVVRIESGEVQTIDLVRIEALTRALGIPLLDIIDPIDHPAQARQDHADQPAADPAA